MIRVCVCCSDEYNEDENLYIKDSIKECSLCEKDCCEQCRKDYTHYTICDDCNGGHKKDFGIYSKILSNSYWMRQKGIDIKAELEKVAIKNRPIATKEKIILSLEKEPLNPPRLNKVHIVFDKDNIWEWEVVHEYYKCGEKESVSQMFRTKKEALKYLNDA